MFSRNLCKFVKFYLRDSINETHLRFVSKTAIITHRQRLNPFAIVYRAYLALML